MTDRPGSDTGHRLLPHTADVMVSAWAPTVEDCLAEAVRGLVSAFAEVAAARPDRMITFAFTPASDEELLVRLLEEVIYVIEVHGAVPAQVAVARTADGGLAGEFGVLPLVAVTSVGPAPKAVTRHGLRLDRDDGTWRCTVLIDV